MARKIPPPPREQRNPNGDPSTRNHGNTKPARTAKQKKVCEECGYFDSHSPTCSKG